MQWLFAELASFDQPLKELAIQNQQNVSPGNTEVIRHIEQVLQNLTSLRLNVIHELDDAAPETEIEVFHNTALNDFLFAYPTARNLLHMNSSHGSCHHYGSNLQWGPSRALHYTPPSIGVLTLESI